MGKGCARNLGTAENVEQGSRILLPETLPRKFGSRVAMTGAGDFRDFSPLRQAKENRRQLVDPAHRM